MSSHYLDFSSCGIVPGFCKSGHKLLYTFIIIYIGDTGLRGQVGVPGTKGDKGYLKILQNQR